MKLKLLEENIGENITLDSAMIDLIWTPKAETTKEKKKKDELESIKNFVKTFLCHSSNDMINQVIRQPIGWKKIFSNHISDRKMQIKTTLYH